MISTKKLISNIKDVPREWVFEYYLNLSEKLDGQNIKMLSVFSSKDKVPSMFIYFDIETSTYKFKDFSSGFQGDHITLVMHLFNLNVRWKAVYKIIDDYQEYLNNNNIFKQTEFKIYDKYKVTDFQIRSWNTLDKDYWLSYKINSTLLKQYNVHPLDYFTMSKTENDTTNTLTFNKPYVYGYFREDGNLYKIYMPKNQDKKFIKVQNYIQGVDQLNFQSDYLLIVSSLKDLLSFKSLGITNIEVIAPDSENTMIGEKIMNPFIEKYKKIIVLFDNDEPGEKAADRYLIKYGVSKIKLELLKDLSDSVKQYGLDFIRAEVFKLLKQVK